MSKTKVYPSTVLADAARAAGARVILAWEMPGPAITQVAWLSCYMINDGLCIVETFRDGNGWEALTSLPDRDVAATIADVLNRCRVPTTSFRRLAASVPT